VGTVTSASAVVLSGAWHSFEGIWWGACKVVGLIVLGGIAAWLALWVWAYFFGDREQLDVIVMGALPDDPGAPLPVRKPPADSMHPAVRMKRMAEAQPRHGCDDDTFVADGLTTELNELLRGEGRG
jgi:hypothetical protein